VLASLSARDFRNLAPLAWRPGAGGHLLVGDNGAGKTSLLEAIYVLATTKSFRSPQLADCARHGGAAFHLEGEAEGAAPVHLAVTVADGEKSRAVNGKPAALGEHLAALPVVAWTAADAELLTGPPALRRRFLDRGLVALRPSALAVLARYRRALAAKRDLLARGPAGGRGAPAAGLAELEPWNQLLAESGAEVIRLRRRYAVLLAAELAAVLDLAALPFPPVEIAYRPSPSSPFGDGDDPAAGGAAEPTDPQTAEPAAADLAAAIGARLGRLAARERERRLPLVGPHRDELAVRWGGRPLRGTVSAGERKAVGLLLVAAQGRVLAAAGRPPVYLLDDADAELAAPTLAAVWRAFAGARQLFVSSNRPRVWEGLAVGATHRLEDGRLRPAPEPPRPG
jgi:DNA replication and repair protein RecF